MKSVRTSEKLVLGRKMNCAVVSTLISLAFVSQAFAVLRPRFPIKPAAPSNGELIIIGDDLVLRSAKKPLMHHRGPGTVGSAWTAGYGLCEEGCPLRRLRSHTDLHAHEPGNVIERTSRNVISSSVNRFRRRQLYSRHSLAAGL